MTTALIQGPSVLAVWDNYPFGPLPNGQYIATSGTYPLPVTFSDGSKLVSATYTDTPGANQVSTGANLASWTVNAGPPVTASGPRNWQTVTPSVPSLCTRSQGLLALLNNGFSTPEATITTAINAISDPIQQQTALIKFQAATWYRADPFITTLGATLGLTSAQIDGLFAAAQAY